MILKAAFRWLLTTLFCTAGVLHFLRPEPFTQIVPPMLPAPPLLVLLSGAAEIAGGVGLAIPKLRRAAGIGLVLLLVAVFPANIYMAIYDIAPAGLDLPWWGHAIRLPLQFVLIGLVVWVTDLWPGRATLRIE